MSARLIASAFLLLVAGNAVGAPLFLSAPSFEVPTNPLTLALGDLNKDGKADLALVNGSAQAVTVYLSAGDGTFQAGTSYSTGPGLYQVLVGDVNGDGNPDLITGNAGTVSVLLGNGDGTFATRVDYAMNGAGLATGDVNGDGRLDVATTTSILLGNGNGTFQAKTDYAAGNTFPLVAIGDLNGDGNADIMTADASTFSVFLSHGDGTFASRADHPMGTPAAAFRRPIEAMSPRSRDSAAYYGNNLWMTLADASGDGRLDLLFVNSNGGQFLSTVTIQLGRGDGTFQARVDYATEDYPSYVAVGDVSGDGKPDIVTANDYSGTVSVLRGRGDGTFAASMDYGVRGNAFSVAIGEVNGDGHPDLVTGSRGSVSVLLGNADGTLGARRATACGRVPFDAAVGDLDGDGVPDVVTANWDQNSLSVLYGNGDGSLRAKVDYPSAFNPHSVAIGDVNGDGIPDLVVGNDYSTVSVFLGRGGRTFGTRADYTTNGSTFSIAIADLNRDGKLDVVSLGSVLLGNGDGTFGTPVDFPLDTGNRIAVADLDGDRKPDMVIVADAGTVSVFRGKGDGTFQSKVDYAAAPHCTSVAIHDLNGDGKPDLVTSNVSPGSVSVLLGNGDGTFHQHVDYVGGGYDVAVSDLDGDGKQDLASANQFASAVCVHLGRGDGTFGAPTNYDSGLFSVSVGIGDLDRDGNPDIVTADRASYTVSVLLNQSPKRSVPFAARVTLDPGVILLGNKAPWVTAYIQPLGFSLTDIDVSSLRLAGSVPTASKFARVLDHDGDGLLELMVKFSRAALDPLLTVGANDLDLTGSLVTGTRFSGRDTVRVEVAAQGVSTRRPSVVPNPVNPEGALSFYVAEAGPVRVRVFDRDGRLVRTLLDAQAMAVGSHRLTIDGRSDRSEPMASGIYFYKIETTGSAATGRFAIVK